MFKILINEMEFFSRNEDGKTVRVKRKRGEDAPEVALNDAAAIMAWVDAGAVEWTGKGGKYGPAAEGVAKIREAQSRIRRPILTGEQPSPQESAPVSRAEFEALLAELTALKAAGSAPASKPDPIPGNRGGR